MPSTLAADRLEFVLAELQDAIVNIESAEAQASDARDELNNRLLDALRKAQGILEEAQGVAEQHGVRKLSIFSA